MLLFKRRFKGPAPGSGSGGGGTWPTVAMRKIGSNWFVDNNNSTRPSGFAVSSDGTNFFIDDAASSGLTLSVTGGNLFVTYP